MNEGKWKVITYIVEIESSDPDRPGGPSRCWSETFASSEEVASHARTHLRCYGALSALYKGMTAEVVRGMEVGDTIDGEDGIGNKVFVTRTEQ